MVNAWGLGFLFRTQLQRSRLTYERFTTMEKREKKTISERGAFILEGVQTLQGPHGMVPTVIGGWNEGGYVLLTTDRNGWR